MSEELTLYSYDAASMTVESYRGNYKISVFGCSPVTLKRGVDFGMIRKKDGSALSKKPTLLKPGAEKVAVAYGLCQRYELVSKIENPESGFFYFLIQCNLVKIVDGKEYIITSAYGSANTREGRNGTQSCYDGANTAVKMAQKRALVSAALSIGCMSDSFDQDIESDTEDAAAYYNNKNPEAPISATQVRFFYAAAGRVGLTKQEAKKILRGHGYNSAKEIKTKDFDALLDELQKEE